MKTSHKHLSVLPYPNSLFLSVISLVVLINLSLARIVASLSNIFRIDHSQPPVFDHKEERKRRSE
jgi:hypothetical protein